MAVPRSPDIVPTGLAFGSVRWGAHLCHFYRTADDLESVIAPYFAAGLANREKCVWIVDAPLRVERARASLASRVTDLDEQLREGRLAIIDAADWRSRGISDPEQRIADWLERERVAIASGFTGLRITTDTSWNDIAWREAIAHTARVHRALTGRRITALCSYPIERCGPQEIMDVLRSHKSALMQRNGAWEHVGSATAALGLVREPAHSESSTITSREHLVVLQSITSALGEAVTLDDVGAVVTAELAPAIGATQVGLVIASQVIALRGVTPDDPTALAQLIEHVPAQWSTRLEQSADVAWIGGALAAVLPLVFGNERIGTLVLGFDEPVLSTSLRALVDDLVCQLSLCVERARVYEQATQDRLRAERANAAKDQFLGMLGHELRNPLSPILSATQLMRLREPDQLVKERATIERSVSHMIRIVDDLLDVARIARGGITLAREPTDLVEIVKSALAVVRGLVDEGLQFSLAVPHDLIVDVDPQRIQQTLVNLLINAAKSTVEQEPVEIAARARGEIVELVIRDHGSGIDPALLPHMFELFVQGRQGTDRAKGGLGVGLPIARSIVELHGGTLTAASEGEGTGSTFTVTLPRWQTERTTDQINVPIVDGGKRILVVDDNEDAAWLLAEALRLLGHDVRVAYEGLAALEVAREWEPEVALLDIGLPGMNGFELCRELANLPQRPYCIAVSGYGQPKDRALAREAGFEAHFVKPVDLRDIQTAIEGLGTSN